MAKPILKWVGGKTQLLGELLPLIEPYLEGHRYYEPFAGGAAVAFALGREGAVLGDLNSELIQLYEVVRDDPDGLLADLEEHRLRHSPRWYYMIRDLDRNGNLAQLSKRCKAARTIYLNKTCFNGLYRVNSKGQFNSPLGRTSSGSAPNIVDRDGIMAASAFLKGVELRNVGYEECVADAKAGDVVYFDPPYDKGDEIGTDGFVGYQKDGWSRDDLARLKSTCDSLVAKGCRVVVSNNDTEFVRSLFHGYEIRSVSARRSVNRDGNSRNSGKEVVIIGIPTV